MKSLLFIFVFLLCACAQEGEKRKEVEGLLPKEELTPKTPPQVFLVGGQMKTPGVYITEISSFPATSEAVCDFGTTENPLRFTLNFTIGDEKGIVHITSLSETHDVLFEDLVLGLLSGFTSIQNLSTRLVMKEDLRNGNLEASVTYLKEDGSLTTTDFVKISEVSNCSFAE